MEMTSQRFKGKEHKEDHLTANIVCRTWRHVTVSLMYFHYLKSDSSSVVEWLIMAQRQSMLELDRARPMHFFTI